MKRLTAKQVANRKARALQSIAASLDKQARNAPKVDGEGLHRMADNLRALAASIIAGAGR
jgi:type III secretion system FlhB-like substrate exporter